MSLNTIVLPVTDDRPVTLRWLKQIGVEADPTGRWPTLGEVRRAVRALVPPPTLFSETFSPEAARWSAQVAFGAVSTSPSGARTYQHGGFEINAVVHKADDGKSVNSLSFRNRHPAIPFLIDALAAVTGALVSVEDSDGKPRLHAGR